jgi:serine/threonine protein kinase
VLIYEMLVGQTPFQDSTPRGIYKKILYGQIDYPWYIDPLAKDLISKLLERHLPKRLGCYSVPQQKSEGSNLTMRLDYIKKHRWFRGVDWELYRKRQGIG